jgi:hypothetical protein
VNEPADLVVPAAPVNDTVATVLVEERWRAASLVGDAWVWSPDLLLDDVVVNTVRAAVPVLRVAVTSASPSVLLRGAVGVSQLCDCRDDASTTPEGACTPLQWQRAADSRWTSHHAANGTVAALLHRAEVLFVTVCALDGASDTSTGAALAHELATVTVSLDTPAPEARDSDDQL